MITIVVTHEDDQSDEFDFSPSQPTITIGRRSTNDVCIPNLSVSGRHSRIAFSKGEAWIEDLNSTNGTYINNRLISRQILNNNDELIIGKTRVRYYNSANQKTAIQAEPAEVIDIRDADAAKDHANAPSKELESAEHTPAAEPMLDEPNAHTLAAESFDAHSSAIDSSATDAPAHTSENRQVADAESFQHDAPESDTSNRVASSAAGGVAAAGAAAIAANQLSDSKASSSESLFEALADDLSERDTPLAQQPENFSPDALDDSSEMSLSDRARAAMGRDAAPASTHAAAAPQASASADTDAPVDSPVDLGARRKVKGNGATIEIKNGAKSGHVIPIDKPVTTLGRPGIQIAAIMRKPDGYFLMHIESNDSVDRPTLNNDFIGDEPMLLHPGDELNVAGINVEFDLVSQQATTSA